VKIINPQRKSDVVVKQLHQVQSKFDSVIDLCVKLVKELQQKVPNSFTFSVGYYEGQHHVKMAIESDEDLQAMYKKYPSGEITLWCDGAVQETSANAGKKRKREETSFTSKFHEREKEVEEVYKELVKKHSDSYDTPKLRLWARMIASNLHENMDVPPALPAFGGGLYKKSRQDSFTSILSSTAVAVTQALKSNSTQACNSEASATALHVDLRMKNLQQLGYLKQLYDDNILTDAEFSEQKENILKAIKKLN